MSALAHPSRTQRPATAARKSVLFCPACERAAPLAEWTVAADGEGESVTCPDCGETLTVRPPARR